MTKEEAINRKKARKILTSLVAELSQKNGYKYNKIAIRNQKTRLGSCSNKLNLNFNWQIIKFPKEIMEYVVKHELAHLKHQNHSKNFWEEVAKLDPEYKNHKKWINKNFRKYIKHSA